MKIISVDKFTLILIASFLYPVFAPSYTYDISQPDGYTFSARMHGSEYYNYIETVDSYTISSKKVGEELWWYYAVNDNGKLKPSDVVVSYMESPPAFSYKLKPQYIQPSISNRPLFREYIHNSRARTIKPLVILVDFSDNSPTTNHQYTKEQFSQLIFEENLSSSALPSSYQMSVKDYYKEASSEGIVIEGGSQSIIDWLTMPESYSYYVDNNQGLGVGEGGSQKSAKAALVHAMELIDVDMGSFDGNGDGVCDLVIMIMEGGDTGASNQFWSFKGALGPGEAAIISSSSPTLNNELVYDGVLIRNFIVTTEAIYHSDGQNYNSGDIRPIGTICHEIGHVLGLPDLYDTSDTSAPGIGDWGLMGTGNWNNQVSPSLLCSWSSARLGLIDVITLDDLSSEQIIIEPIHISNIVYKLNIGNEKTGEYILLENRSAIGTDIHLKAEGLLAWHIDERLTTTFPMYNEVNIYEDFYGVRLLEAGGTNHLSSESGFIYSSESHVFNGLESSSINDSTNPSLKGNSYDKDADGIRELGILSNLEIENILLNGNNIELSVTAPELMGERRVYSESGVQGVADLGDNIPGVKYSPEEDEYLKLIQTPIIYKFGSIDSIELSIYDITINSSQVNSHNIVYNNSIPISWGCNRSYGTIDIYIDNLYLDSQLDYFIQIDYKGDGAIVPLEFSFFSNIEVSGSSYRNIDGTLHQINNADFSITLITSQDAISFDDEASSCNNINITYPYPNPSSGEIRILTPDDLDGSIEVSLYNLIGQKIIEKSSNSTSSGFISISTTNIPSGVYFVVLTDKDGDQKKYKISIIN